MANTLTSTAPKRLQALPERSYRRRFRTAAHRESYRQGLIFLGLDPSLADREKD